MIDEVVMDEPMNQPRPARPKAPEVFISQRSKVLRLERQIKDLKAQVRDLKAELQRKVRARKFGSHRRYRCLHLVAAWDQ
jgi:hypothetical protein